MKQVLLRDNWLENHRLILPMFTQQKFKLKKFAGREPPFTSSIRCQDMSVTVDTTKYTQFYTLQRLCTFTKGPNQPKLSSHCLW